MFWKEGIHLQASFSHHVTKWHRTPHVPIHHIPPDRELFRTYLIVLIEADISLICPEKVNWEMSRVIWAFVFLSLMNSLLKPLYGIIMCLIL